MTFLTNFFTMASLIGLVAGPSLLNIILYPFSKKLCIKVSDYIVSYCAPMLFRIAGMYKGLKTTLDRSGFDKLPEQFLVITNHQSLLDIPVFMCFFKEHNVRFVAKDTLSRHIPLVSEMLRVHEHCFIPRKGSPSVAMKTLDEFGKRVVERKQIPILFPEGTRSKNGDLGTFYSAGFRRLSESCGLPVVACCLDEGYKANDFLHALSNLGQINYKCKVVGVFDAPKSKEDQVKILEESKALMQKQLDEWRK